MGNEAEEPSAKRTRLKEKMVNLSKRQRGEGNSRRPSDQRLGSWPKAHRGPAWGRSLARQPLRMQVTAPNPQELARPNRRTENKSWKINDPRCGTPRRHSPTQRVRSAPATELSTGDGLRSTVAAQGRKKGPQAKGYLTETPVDGPECAYTVR